LSHEFAPRFISHGSAYPARKCFDQHFSCALNAPVEMETFETSLFSNSDDKGNRDDDMERDLDSLVALYVAGLCSKGYGLRQIIEAQAGAGAPVETIVISGGAGQHPLTRQLLADACGIPVATPVAEEPAMLGSAMLGSVAAGVASSVTEAMQTVSTARETLAPATAMPGIHNSRFAAYKTLQQDARLMRDCLSAQA
jgi:ribulose kinase